MSAFFRLPRRTRNTIIIIVLAAVTVLGSVALVIVRHQGPPPLEAGVTPSSHPATAAASATSSVTAAPTPTPTPTLCSTLSGGPPSGTIAANYPVALAFAPGGRLFYAERGGTIRVLEGGSARVFATVATVTAEPGGGYSERGLLGLAISPTFATDHYVYAMYALQDYQHEDVVRWRDCGGVGTAMTRLAEFPSGADCCHKGGRLAFGPDGKLYVTLGEQHSAPAAQNTADVRGKILRYNPDGSIPADNPFGAANPVWAYGFRNPFGLAFSPDGTLMVTDNGPSGDAGSPSTGYDLAETVVKGGGYEWPFCYGYQHPISPNRDCHGRTGPGWSSEADVGGRRTVVPSGVTFVDAGGPPGYAGHFVFCSFFRGMRILSPGSPHASVAVGPSTCTLDVKQGPDHALYFSDDSHIYRLA